jgi:hypothetical protein
LLGVINAFKNKWLMLTKTLCESGVIEPMTLVELVESELVILVEPVLMTPIE